MGLAARAAFLALCLTAAPIPVVGQEGQAPPTPEQLAAIERIRPVAEPIFQELRAPKANEDPDLRYFWTITDRILAIGPDVMPFLVSEVDLMDPETFNFAAYAMGRLGGPDAEAALRKSIRAADAEGGPFGRACKRFAVFSLALMGKTDAIDLMHEGADSLHGAAMVPDLSMFAHVSILLGPSALPPLSKQLETYRADPTASDKLEDTIGGIGRVGDASYVPKLVPFLTNASPAIRTQAADAISRLAEPSVCDKLLPLLASPEVREREIVASSLARWKPQPCYKAMIGRLEIERDVVVRGRLYAAIAAIGGESSLEVFRPYLRTSNQFDQALVIWNVGQLKSRKGVNMLRGLLDDESGMVVTRAMESMAAIGGDAAIETIRAATADRRRSVAESAREILIRIGDKTVAPRVAGELVGFVKDPVGNLGLRPRIYKLCESLVELGYTDPLDDLKAALAVQTDVEIVDSLTSCIRRLQALAKNKDDVALWTADTASPFADVRRLADRRLAQIGSPAAIKSLGARFDKTDLPPEERTSALLAIAEARTQTAAGLVERQLSDPAYDGYELESSRAAAAWAARRLGGDRMAKALRDSAVRRDGGDWPTLVYLAVLDKSAALPTLKELRSRRLRYPRGDFGHQADQLDGIIADLSGGRVPAQYDVPPEELSEL